MRDHDTPEFLYRKVHPNPNNKPQLAEELPEHACSADGWERISIGENKHWYPIPDKENYIVFHKNASGTTAIDMTPTSLDWARHECHKRNTRQRNDRSAYPEAFYRIGQIIPTDGGEW